jgi:superfamily II DNA/RNA helicase
LKFEDFNLDPEILYSIQMVGYSEATPIQDQAIPLILDGKDVIGCAQTGTGKTAAYLLPVIHRLMKSEPGHIRTLILVPTRELALQIDEAAEAFCYTAGISTIPILGGKEGDVFTRQKMALQRGTDIVIATPGRLMMHMALGYVDFTKVETVILDEADKMLDMGFYGDIIRVIQDTPKDRQTLLFSATMPNAIRDLAREIMVSPEEINLKLAKPAEGINQIAYSVYDNQKIPLLESLIREREVDSMIIFASSKASVDNITRRLQELKYNVKAIHSDKEQAERQQTLREFKNKQFPIVVATDVLSRGIDIDNLSHVLNFDCPRDAEDYVHRVGRTARASAKGEAITFVNPKDQYRLVKIERLIGNAITMPELPPEVGKGPEYDPNQRKGKGKGRDSGRKGPGGDRRGGERREGDRRNRGDRKPKSEVKGRSEKPGEKPEHKPRKEGEGPSAENKNRRRRGGRRRGGKGPASGDKPE